MPKEAQGAGAAHQEEGVPNGPDDLMFEDFEAGGENEPEEESEGLAAIPVADYADAVEFDDDGNELEPGMDAEEKIRRAETAKKEESETGDDKEFEKAAKMQGWIPKDKFKGNPEDWKPAREWVEENAEINRSLRKELREIKQQLREQQKAVSEYSRSSIESRTEAAKRRIEELNKQVDDAFETGNAEEGRAAMREIAKLEAQIAQQAGRVEDRVRNPKAGEPGQTRNAGESQQERDLREWTRRNDWYLEPDMRQLADNLADLKYAEYDKNDPDQFRELLTAVENDPKIQAALARRNGSKSAPRAHNDVPTPSRTGTGRRDPNYMTAEEFRVRNPQGYKIAMGFIEDGTFKNWDEYWKKYARTK